VTLNDQNLTDGSAFQAQLHQVTSWLKCGFQGGLREPVSFCFRKTDYSTPSNGFRTFKNAVHLRDAESGGEKL
jgi:hypothetical protein